MAKCENLDACPFFNDAMLHMPTTSEWLKNEFCYSNFTQCARYRLKNELGKEYIPRDMFPDDMQAAQRIMDSIAKQTTPPDESASSL